MRSAASQKLGARPSAYRRSTYTPRGALSSSRLGATPGAAAAAAPAAAAAQPAIDAPSRAEAVEAEAPQEAAAAAPAAVLVSNLPAAACNGLYVLAEEQPADSPHYTNGDGQHLYRVKEFERRALAPKWVISSTFSPGGSSLGRRAVIAWQDGQLPPLGQQTWGIVADAPALLRAGAADESMLSAPVTLTAIPESSVAALTSLEGAAQRARAQQRDSEAELDAVKRQLTAKVADAQAAEGESSRLEEKLQRVQGEMERMTSRFEGLLQEKVAEIARLGTDVKALHRQRKQEAGKADLGRGEAAALLRSLGPTQVHCTDALLALSEFVEQSEELGGPPEPISARPEGSLADADAKEPLWEAELWRRLSIKPPPVDSTGSQKAADDLAKGLEVLMNSSVGDSAEQPPKLALDRLQTSSQSLSGLSDFLVAKESLKSTFVLARHSREQPSLVAFYNGNSSEPVLAGFYGDHGADPAASSSWHCVVDGAESCELSHGELSDLYLSGRVTDTTKCWSDGMNEWAAIGSLGAFAAAREKRSGMHAVSGAIGSFIRLLESSVQSHLRESGGMRAVDQAISRIVEQCVLRPMNSCLALKTEQEKAAATCALLAERQKNCEHELSQLRTMLEVGTSQVSLDNVDTVYALLCRLALAPPIRADRRVLPHPGTMR